MQIFVIVCMYKILQIKLIFSITKTDFFQYFPKNREIGFKEWKLLISNTILQSCVHANVKLSLLGGGDQDVNFKNISSKCTRCKVWSGGEKNGLFRQNALHLCITPRFDETYSTLCNKRSVNWHPHCTILFCPKSLFLSQRN